MDIPHRLLGWLARRSLRLLHALGGELGWAGYLLSASYRQRLRTNAALAGIGPSERRAAVADADVAEGVPEADAHISRKLALMGDIGEKLTFLKSEKVKEKANELMLTPDGNDRFFLLDNRDGPIEEIQSTIEELVVSCGCKVIILEPLQDCLDGLSNEEQAVCMKWMKGFIKSHGCTFVLIN